MKVRGGRHTDDIGLHGKSSSSNKRPRAYSESWVGQGWPSKDFADLKQEGPDGTVLLPQMLDHYAEIYNKNGRIGIYNREERDTIIERFREKKRRRVWKKKIRYHCRKNLADRRVRVKGRFVRRGGPDGGDDGAPSPSGDGSQEGDEEEGEEGESDDGAGEAETATTSSGDVTESGSKRSRKEEAGSSSKKSKKRRVLFDETVKTEEIDNGEGAASSVGGTSVASSSGTNSASGSSQGGEGPAPGGQRMRRHSIAY
jgi:hypothetical protein